MALTLEPNKAVEPLPSRVIAQAPARRIGSFDKFYGWLPLLALLGMWELVSDLGLVRPFLLPSLSSVLVRIYTDAQEGDLIANLGQTLWRTLLGFGISGVLGVTIGLLMVRVRAVNWLFDPLVSIGFPMPKIAFLPIFVLWLGLYDVSKVTMIVFNDVFPIITATVAGVKAVEQQIIWSARNLGTGERRMMWDILLPAASPQIITGLQVALPIALIVAIITEMSMGGYGIGAVMQNASRMADSRGVFAGIIEIAVVGYILVKLMSYARARILRWHSETLHSDH